MTISRTSPLTRLAATAAETIPAERMTLPWEAAGTGTSLLTVLFKESSYRSNAGVIVGDSELFIRRMQTVVWQTEAHQDRRNAQVLRKFSDDRDRSAGARQHGRATERLAEYRRRRPNGGMISTRADRSSITR